MGSLDATLTVPQGPHGAPGPRGPHGPSGSEVRTLGLGEGFRGGPSVSQEGEVGVPVSLLSLVVLQGSPGLRGGVGQPGAVGEKVRERGLHRVGEAQPVLIGGGCSGEPFPVSQH